MGSPYTQRRGSSGGSAYTKRRSSSTRSSAKPKSGGGGGILGTLGRIPGAFLRGAEQAALGTPAGLMELQRVGRVLSPAPPGIPFVGRTDPRTAIPFVEATAQGLKTTVEDPLRDPFATATLILPFVGTGARVGLAAQAAARAEGTAAKLAALRAKPDLGDRVLDVDGMQVRGNYSRASGSALVQRAADKALMRAKPGSKRENLLHKRAAKWEERNQRVADAKARAAGTRLQVLGKRLKPHEQIALRVVAEEVPLRRRIAAQEMRLARATNPKEQARHQERIDLNRAAEALIEDGPDGKPVFRADASPRVRAAYVALERASADRAEILSRLDLLDEAAQQTAKTKAARLAAGGTYVAPTPGKLGVTSQALKRSRQRVVSLEGRLERLDKMRTPEQAQARLTALERQHDMALDKMAAGMFGKPDQRAVNQRTAHNRKVGKNTEFKYKAMPTVKDEMRIEAEKRIEAAIEKNPDHPTLAAWRARTAEIDALRTALNPELGEKVKRKTLGREAGTGDQAKRANLEGAAAVAREDLGRAEKGAAARVTPTGVVGADDITVSPDAPFIGNPVDRSRITGRPKVSSTGTFGHTPTPGSMKTATGAAVERATGRNDVPQLVAERHAEAARLASIDRRVQAVKKAGKAAPTRKDDVWVWTDKTASKEALPKDVRKYLDDPDAIRERPDAEQQSILDMLRAATLEKHDWQADAEARARFEQLAAEGKGVFVPRRLLGDAAKRTWSTATPNVLVTSVDTVNNAQKAALIYLKLNYPIIQAMSNTAMGIIQQGFAWPMNVSNAVRLSRSIGPDGAAVIEDIMGQGAVVQAAFHGEGAVSHMSQKIAGVMTRKIDRPARLSAFLHEARKAGYGTPEKWKQLIEDDANVGDLAAVAQRAKEAIVDYGELSPFERNVVRRVLFVYPWQKGAVKYAGHFLRDHPVQAAALAQVAAIGQDATERNVGETPSYMRGVFDVDGKLVNPAGVNFFQTPAQIGRGVVGAATGQPDAPSLQEFLSPAPGAAVALLTGRDDIGRPLEGNVAARLRDTLVAPAALSSLARAAAKDHEGPGGDLFRNIFGSRTATKTFPDSNDAYWRFLFGGIYPRTYDKKALARNAALEKSGR